MMPEIIIKRIYASPTDQDGYRILVDRLWPRGVSKERARLDLWAKELAPTSGLRKEFQHKPELMEVFKRKYRAELDERKDLQEPKFKQTLKIIREKLEKVNVTLLYGAKDVEHNHAIVLQAWLQENI